MVIGIVFKLLVLLNILSDLKLFSYLLILLLSENFFEKYESKLNDNYNFDLYNFLT